MSNESPKRISSSQTLPVCQRADTNVCQDRLKGDEGGRRKEKKIKVSAATRN